MVFTRKKIAVLCLCLIIASVFGSYVGATRYFLKEMAVQARAENTLHKEVIRGWLGRYRGLASIYADHNEIINVLIDPSIKNKRVVNRMLENWASSSGASDVYLLDATGRAIAASNWNDPLTFVGKEYTYRPYYTQAMQGRLGRFFALGTTSGKRGYFFSYPVRSLNDIIGVMVVKVTVSEIEQDLRARENEIFIANDAGVVIIASHPNWRLKTLGPLNEKSLNRIALERQFDDADLLPIGIDGVEIEPSQSKGAIVYTVADRSKSKKSEFLQFHEPMTAEGWNLHLLISADKAYQQALLVAAFVGAVLLVFILLGAMLLQRRNRLMLLLEVRDQARQNLELKVEERTADLKKSNEELHQTQSELVQAGKMAALGQMSTALSHEFNQPLTAIRTYAENAIAFMDRGQEEKAGENLKRVLTLTERMAQLSKRLSTFARKPADNTRPVQLSLALHEALELLQARIERSMVHVDVDVPDVFWVIGGQIRLQHVLMNLIGNAMDEISDAPHKWIKITAQNLKGLVRLEVLDSGAGIPVEIIDKIFDPFFTTKEVGKGVGLGLSISYNIVRDFEGSLRVENHNDGGACFILELKQTTAPEV